MSPARRVSVVIPCYNAAPYLAEALRSVLSQVPTPHEVIVVDDGSTDGSGDIARGFGDPVRVVRQEQQGASAARNHGVLLSSGDVLAFLDADDVWPPGSLAVRLAPLEHQPELESVSGLVSQFISPELPEEARRKLVSPEGTSRGRVAGSMLIRRPAFDRVGWFDPSFRIGEAIDWVARADMAGVTNRVVETVVLHRRLHTTNTTSRLKDERAEYLRVLKASLDRRRAAVRSSEG